MSQCHKFHKYKLIKDLKNYTFYCKFSKGIKKAQQEQEQNKEINIIICFWTIISSNSKYSSMKSDVKNSECNYVNSA